MPPAHSLLLPSFIAQCRLSSQQAQPKSAGGWHCRLLLLLADSCTLAAGCESFFRLSLKVQVCAELTPPPRSSTYARG